MELEQEVRAYLETLRDQHPKTKDEVRAVLHERKRENLIRERAKLKKWERRSISLIGRVNYADIRPTMAWCSPKNRPIWVYLRHCVSSAPWQDRPGRALYLFCVDQNSGGILGLVDIGSDLQVLGPRDKYIGWTHERKLKGGGLRHVANLGTCIGVWPFGALTGGKYMSVAVTASEVGQVWRDRYGDKLAAITTTSLYGKSSQYNRLGAYEYLGCTNGGGIAHLSQRGHKLIKSYLDSQNFIDAHGRGGSRGGPAGGFGSRLNDLMHVIKLLGLDFDKFRSGQPRGVYFAERGVGVLLFLRGESADFEERADAWDGISEWWLDRWYSMRWPKKKDEIAEFDPSIYEVDRQIALCGPGVQGDTPSDQEGEPGSSPGVRL